MLQLNERASLRSLPNIILVFSYIRCYKNRLKLRCGAIHFVWRFIVRSEKNICLILGSPFNEHILLLLAIAIGLRRSRSFFFYNILYVLLIRLKRYHVHPLPRGSYYVTFEALIHRP